MDDMLRVASLAKEPLPGTCCVVSWGERILGGGGRQQLGPLKYSCHVFWKGFLNSFDFFLKREGTQQKSDGRWTTWDESNELGQKDEGKVSTSLRPGATRNVLYSRQAIFHTRWQQGSYHCAERSLGWRRRTALTRPSGEELVLRPPSGSHCMTNIVAPASHAAYQGKGPQGRE